MRVWRRQVYYFFLPGEKSLERKYEVKKKEREKRKLEEQACWQRAKP